MQVFVFAGWPFAMARLTASDPATPDWLASRLPRDPCLRRPSQNVSQDRAGHGRRSSMPHLWELRVFCGKLHHIQASWDDGWRELGAAWMTASWIFSSTCAKVSLWNTSRLSWNEMATYIKIFQVMIGLVEGYLHAVLFSDHLLWGRVDHVRRENRVWRLHCPRSNLCWRNGNIPSRQEMPNCPAFRSNTR